MLKRGKGMPGDGRAAETRTSDSANGVATDTNIP